MMFMTIMVRHHSNGAMAEGYADLWGMTITLDPILGKGFSGGTTTYVRRYDIDPKVYPEDLVGEVHADGEIICGAWWDYGVATRRYYGAMRDLVAGNYSRLERTDHQVQKEPYIRDVLLGCFDS